MAGFILVVVIVSAVLASGTPVQRIDLDRMPPPLPENVAAYEASAGGVALAY
jgi:hypothetical protein